MPGLRQGSHQAALLDARTVPLLPEHHQRVLLGVVALLNLQRALASLLLLLNANCLHFCTYVHNSLGAFIRSLAMSEA